MHSPGWLTFLYAPPKILRNSDCSARAVPLPFRVTDQVAQSFLPTLWPSGYFCFQQRTSREPHFCPCGSRPGGEASGRHGPSQASCSPQPPAQLSPSFPLHHARCNSRSSLSELIKSTANRKKKKKSPKKSRLSRKPRGTVTSPPPRRGADFRSFFVSAKSPPGCLKLRVQNG